MSLSHALPACPLRALRSILPLSPRVCILIFASSPWDLCVTTHREALQEGLSAGSKRKATGDPSGDAGDPGPSSSSQHEGAGEAKHAKGLAASGRSTTAAVKSKSKVLDAMLGDLDSDSGGDSE